jgi:cell division protein FtsB
LSYINNKKEKANLRRKIDKLKKKIKNKKREIINLTTKLKK